MAKRSEKKKINKIARERYIYATEWTQDAHYFSSNDFYCWMNKFVEGYGLVLEVGIGDGTSTLSLLNSGHKVIGIDENTECINLAKNKLREAGKKVIIVEREKISFVEEQIYKVEYKPIDKNIDDFDAVLIEGDIINDDNLINWLKKVEPFDAVVCWLIGTHGARRFNTAVMHLRTPKDYRLIVQNRVYEVSDEILRSGGILHIVDRVEAPTTTEMQEDFLNSHREQASVTSLEVKDLDYTLYDPDYEGVEMGLTLGQLREVPEELKLALLSIKSYKP